MNNDKDKLGERMKQYESTSKTFLTNKVPVIIRLDGKAFHTFTRGFKRPFDTVLADTMQETMKYLCENVQNVVLGYTQSDEITLVLIDDKKEKTSAWFDNKIQKICSISASMATMKFNQEFRIQTCLNGNSVYEKAIAKGAMFDSRCFNLPINEVINCLIWRQQDATRNSIQMVGQSQFSHKQLQKKNCNEIQEMLWQEKQINWNDTPTCFKRGVCCKKKEVEIETPNGTAMRGKWFIDLDIPIFTKDREYVTSEIEVKE